MGLKRHIPNTITLLNLLCGTIAVIFALKGWQLFAIYLILIAAVMDFLDGFSARMLKAYSNIGKELDSLADLVSFGLAPSILIYYRFSSFLSYDIYSGVNSLWIELLSFTPLVITLASALRLAIFNIDTRQTKSFIGVPTPANAILIAMFMHFTLHNSAFDGIYNNYWFFPLLSLLLSYLLVCSIPMFSLKIKSLKYNDNKRLFIFLLISLIFMIVIIASGSQWSLALFVLFANYILFNSLIFIYEKLFIKG
ncbi:MAG: CDP-diacylglycerol--serine O-phosphatidyltransferase [Bacteroidales bacterium]|nr:CDP-diacylglycerol--serine O-phosphatidyltransferase [Bacteroidales bacterium]